LLRIYCIPVPENTVGNVPKNAVLHLPIFTVFLIPVYNGRWYTDVKAIKIENQSLNQQEQNPVDVASTGIDRLPWENTPLE